MSSVVELLSKPVEDRTPNDLITMLRCAVKLEHATLPPYLTAWWSIRDRTNPAYGILASVVFEEMGHLGTACNLLTTVGGTPAITDPNFVLKYPDVLPCKIAPKVTPPNVVDWKIGLSRLSPQLVSDYFMIIEYPEKGPLPFLELWAHAREKRPEFNTVGEFYDAVKATLKQLVGVEKSVKITGDRQLVESFGAHSEGGENVLKPILTLDDALDAVEHIKEQGEGTPHSPDATLFGHELAHYYRFKEIAAGRFFKRADDGTWSLTGPFFDFPAVHPMAPIPDDGHTGPGVPQAVADQISQFNGTYKKVLGLLQSAWEKGGDDGQNDLKDAEIAMDGLRYLAVNLMTTPIDPNDPSKGNYGPTFRVS